MKKSYKHNGETVIITDEEGKTTEEKNIDNIEEILVLENEIESLEKQSKEEQYIIDDLEAKKRSHKKALLAGGAVLVGVITIGSVIGNNLASAAITGGSIAFAAGFLGSVISDAPKKKDIKTRKKKIKNFELMSKILDDDLELAKEESLEISRTSEKAVDISNCSLGTEYFVDDYTKNHFSIKNSYRIHDKVQIPEYDETENYYLTKMIRAEQKQKKSN